MPTTFKQVVIGFALLAVVAVETLNSVSLLPAVSPQATAAVPRQGSPQPTKPVAPSSIDPAMLMELDNLPTDLTDTITASLHSSTEIIAVKHTDKVPLEPMAPWINEVWCITVYPSASITLYVERYVAPKDALYVSSEDYVPGAMDTGTIDHFFAFRRGHKWELYNPGIYNWKKLGC